jgi:putative endonuclease
MPLNSKRKKSSPPKPPTPKQRLGSFGEHRAAEFLRRKNYSILALNYKRKFGEIDIIAKDKNEIVFVEVKTRTGQYNIHPSEAVDWKKLNKIFRTGILFLQEHHISADFRCDVIALLPDSIEHFENVTLE